MLDLDPSLSLMSLTKSSEGKITYLNEDVLEFELSRLIAATFSCLSPSCSPTDFFFCWFTSLMFHETLLAETIKVMIEADFCAGCSLITSSSI